MPSTPQERTDGSAVSLAKPRYHDVVYTNQDARIRDGRLILPHGASGPRRIRLPDTAPLPGRGRVREVRLSFGVVRLICEVAADAPCPQQTVIGVDLGVNTLIAATDGMKVLLVSGRGVKAVIQWRNKTLASIQQAQSGQTTGSLRWKRVHRRKYRKYQALDKTKRQVRDATHKATHASAEAFPAPRVTSGTRSMTQPSVRGGCTPSR